MEQEATTEKPATEQPPVAVAETVTEKPAEVEKPVAEKPQTEQTERKPHSFFAEKRVAEKQQRLSKEKEQAMRIAELERKLAERESAKPVTESKAPSLLDDPEGYQRYLEERATNAARSEFERREAEFHERENARKFTESAQKANDWLLTRSHLKADKSAEQALAQILETRYPHVAAIDPEAAARSAYVDWCASKGVIPDMEGFKSQGFSGAGGASTVGTRPVAPAPGKKIFEKGEARKYINAAQPGTEEFNRRMAEVDEAYKEGRVKR